MTTTIYRRACDANVPRNRPIALEQVWIAITIGLVIGLSCVNANADEGSLTALAEALESDDGSQRVAAVIALSELGANAAPAKSALLRGLQDEEAFVRVFSAKTLVAIGDPANRPAVIPVVVAELDQELRWEAQEILREVGLEAVPALAKLMRQEDESLASSAAQTLGSIGRPAMATILALAGEAGRDDTKWYAEEAFDRAVLDFDIEEDLLQEAKSPSAAIRAGAAYFLDWHVVSPRRATQVLSGLLQDPNRDVRANAVESLGEIGSPAASVADELLRLLATDDEDSLVRLRAVKALSRILTKERLRPILVPLLHHNDELVRREAAFNLGFVGDVRVAAPLQQALNDGSVNVRLAAAGALAHIGDGVSAQVAVPVLVDLLAAEHAGTRWSATRLLEELAPVAAEAVPALIRTLYDNDPRVRIGAIRALAGIGLPALPSLPEIIPLLVDSDASIRREATQTVGLLAPSDELVELMRKQLVDADGEVRQAAVKSFSARATPAVAIPLLLPAFHDQDLQVRIAAIQAFAGFGKAATELSPLCIARLNQLINQIDTDRGAHNEAAELALAIGEIAGAGPDTAELLAQMLDASKPEGKICVARALRGMGPLAKDALPQLIALLTVEDRQLVLASLAAIAGIGPSAEAAVDPLVELLTSSEFSIEVAYVLGEIGSGAKTAQPILESMMSEGPVQSRIESAAALVKIDRTQNSWAVDFLLESATSGEDRNRLLAAERLADLNYRDSTQAIASELLQMLAGDPQQHDFYPAIFDPRLRWPGPHDFRAQAVRALSKLRPVSPQTLDALTSLVPHDVLLVMKEAIHALGDMGNEAQSAIPVLEQALFDLSLRQAAQAALLSIRSESQAPLNAGE